MGGKKSAGVQQLRCRYCMRVLSFFERWVAQTRCANAGVEGICRAGCVAEAKVLWRPDNTP